MNNWQFLIQKQGERRWHPLESATMKLPEGKYRVVANSNYANTDVEVRVTHYSHYESPPKRYVKKRSRRTNADGVVAIIPFTFLKPGSWELRCSGDLMSDIMGQNWKFSVRLEVLPDDADQNLAPDRGRDGAFEQPTSQHSQKSTHPDLESLSTSPSLDDDRMGDATITISAEQVTVTSSQPTMAKSASLQTPEDVSVTDVAENLPPTQNDFLDWNNVTTNLKDNLQDYQLAVRKSVTEEEQELDELVNPVLLKGETAEQILQNLADLALPNVEPALEEEEVVESTPEVAELPLIITLEKETYFVTWGEKFTIQGSVEFKDETTDDRIYGGELQIELRSPLGGSSETSPSDGNAIAQTKQVVTNNTIPVNFTCELQVPQDCPSKLVLADINLFGSANADGEATLLASHTFTINAAVTELLALSAAAQSLSNEELLNFSDIVVAKNTREETRVSTPLDLQLFDLVKTLPKEQTLVTQTKEKTSLPPRVEPYSLQKTSHRRSPELPFSNKKYPNTEDLVAGIQVKENKSRTLPYLKKLSPLLLDQELQPSPEITEEQNPHNLEADNGDKTDDLAKNVESSQSIPETPLSSKAELITTTGNPDSISPLIRQWMQNQGYTLPQPINVQYQEYDTEQIFLHELDVAPGAITTEESSPADLAEKSQKDTQDKLLTSQQHKPTWLSQEIVVDDITDSEPEMESVDNSLEQAQELPSTIAETSLLPTPEITAKPLPIPELYIPTGELIAGKPIKVRIVLPNLGPHIAVKLWIKDFQTRRLLNEPHILKNWLPQPPGHLQLITQIQVPLGCLEIQFEAIAIDLTTQRESHKVTIFRSVIPEDLLPIPKEELMII